jgi:hypothetical protein
VIVKGLGVYFIAASGGVRKSYGKHARARQTSDGVVTSSGLGPRRAMLHAGGRGTRTAWSFAPSRSKLSGQGAKDERLTARRVAPQFPLKYANDVRARPLKRPAP